MFERGKKRHIVDILFALALFCVFALSALTLVTLGANVYRNTVKDMSENYSVRTAAAYLTEKIRQNDAAGAVFLTSLQGTDALALSRTSEGAEYRTYLYLHEGYLKELFVRAGSRASSNLLSAGRNILEAEGFDIKPLDASLLKLTLTVNGRSTTLYIHLHS